MMKFFGVSQIFGPLPGLFLGWSSYKFFTALEANNIKKVTKLINKKRKLFKYQQVDTGLGPIHVVAQKGNTELLGAICKRKEIKAHINEQNNVLEWTPLHCAASEGQVESLKLLHKAGALLDLKNKEGCSPIHVAAGKNNLSILTELIERGAHIDDTDSKSNWTPLHYASFQNQIEAVEWLVKHGAKPGAKDKHGFTPIFAGAQGGNIKVVQFLHRYKEGYQRPKTKVQLIHIAAQLPEKALLEWLHSSGHDLVSLDASGASALHYAAYGSSIECAEYLVRNSQLVQSKDENWNTPLHLAVMQQSPEIVKLLCQHGAVTKVENSRGMTPLDIAEALRDSQIKNVLKRYK